MAHLLLLTGAIQGRRFPLERDRLVLGRDPGCDIVINETMFRQTPAAGRTGTVSRKHALICCSEGKYYLEDGDGQGTRSRNGTFVNETPVPFPERVLLQENDRIRICACVCTFHEDQQAEFAVEASLSHDSSIQALQTQPADKLRVILEISNSLSNALEIDAHLPRLVDHLFQLFKQAERGFIILWDDASQQLIPQVFKARRASDERDARFSVSIVRQCVEKLEAILGNDPVQQFPDSQSISDLPIRSLLCAPLWSQDRQPLGAIQLDAQGTNTKFTQEDLNLLLGVASQASIALCNARLYRESLGHQRRERDLDLARQVQRALLPQNLPDLPGYDFYAYYESALEIGGDYYDFIPLPEHRLAVLLGDVAGKGVAAALVMVKFSVEARVCLLSEPDLAAAVQKLNALMSRAALVDTFVTLAAVVLDPATHTATLVNAGHPSPLLPRRATGEVEAATPTDASGPPIGVYEGADYTARQVQLQPGDGLVLFSDGVTEAMDAQGRQFGTKEVRSLLEARAFTARETGERLIAAVRQHAAGRSQHDDITLVCFGRVSE